MNHPVALPPEPHPDPLHDPLALALVDEVCERGPDAGDPDRVARRAGVSRAEFDRRYTGFDECLVDTYERFIASFERDVGLAFNRHDQWRDALRAAAYASAEWMEASTTLVEFGIVGVLKTKNELVRVRREELAQFCARLIDRGRDTARDPDKVPELAALTAIGSIFHLLTQKVQEGTDVSPAAMVPEMMYVVVRTYLGEEAAREELTPVHR